MAKSSERLILVTGATGKQGGAVFKHLVSKGFPVRALTRDAAQPAARAITGPGVEIAEGDLHDPSSLTRALEGVYGVYSVQDWTEGTDSEVEQGINLANAANRSAISHFVYSSVASADKNTGIPHFESKFKVEEHIRATGMPYTILRPAFFMENLLGMKGEVEKGTFSWPLTPDRRLQMVAVDDIGVFAALAFTHPGKWQGKAVELAGDELAVSEIVESLARMSEREVAYQQVRWEAFRAQAGEESATMFKWFQEVGYDIDIPALRAEYSKLTHFEPWLREHWGAATSAGE